MRRSKQNLFALLPIVFMAAILAAALASRAGSTPLPAAAQNWEPAIHAFETQDQAHPPKPGSIVFTGSSSFVRWSTLSEYMKPLPVLNRAFGGSEYPDVNQYVARTVIKYRPPAVVVYAGDNDLAASEPNTPESVAREVQRFVETVHGQLPDTWIYVVSIKPSYLRWDAWPRMKKANQLIQQYVRTQQRVEYVDVATPMFYGQAKPPRDLFVEDGLHPTAKCYALWTTIFRPILMKRFGPGASSLLNYSPTANPLSELSFAAR
jgi:hypothetical protein